MSNTSQHYPTAGTDPIPLNYDQNSLLTFDRVYCAIPGNGSGTSGTNYDRTDYGYTVMRLLNRVKTSAGTISRTMFHAMGWAKEQWLGRSLFTKPTPTTIRIGGRRRIGGTRAAAGRC